MARPTACTPATIAAIAQAISAGNAREVAAAYAGVTATTFYNWQARGKKEQAHRVRPNAKPHEAEQPFFEFIEAIEKAESDAEVRNVAIIQQAARESWQAAAWWLERKHHGRWGRKDRQELTGADGAPLLPNVREVVINLTHGPVDRDEGPTGP